MKGAVATKKNSPKRKSTAKKSTDPKVRKLVPLARLRSAVSALRTTTVEPVADTLALEAADVALDYGLAMADTIIFATASRHNAEIVTGDADFDGLPGVTLIR